jgi:hypothetical protein
MCLDPLIQWASNRSSLSNAISTKWGAKNYIMITNLACKEMCLGVIIWASNRSNYVQTHNFPPNDEQRIMFWSLACKEMLCFPTLIWASNRLQSHFQQMTSKESYSDH